MFNQKNFKVKRHGSLHNFKTWLMFTAQKKNYQVSIQNDYFKF